MYLEETDEKGNVIIPNPVQLLASTVQKLKADIEIVYLSLCENEPLNGGKNDEILTRIQKELEVSEVIFVYVNKDSTVLGFGLGMITNPNCQIIAYGAYVDNYPVPAIARNTFKNHNDLLNALNQGKLIF
jgi:hypothetical protein